MAPATRAGATSRAVRARAGWDRDSIVNAIQEWVATYGEPPRAADWNPSAAKWCGQLWRVARYRAGRADGSPWPALNSAKRPFGGSLHEAVRAAGFELAKPGPKRRGDVDPEQASRAVISPEGRAMIEAGLARAREAERACERAERLAARKPKVVRAEATVNTLRAERRGLKAERDRLVAATEREAATELATATKRDEREVARALEAERRAVAAERELRETVAAVKGERRRLTAAELAELRAARPAGPVVMAAALKALAKARAGGGPTELRAALTEVAQAAVTWRERI